MGTMSFLIFDKKSKKNLTPNKFRDISGENCVKHFFVQNDLKQNKVSSPFCQDFFSCKNSSFCKNIKNHF